jgi:hypothetical protein
MSAIYERRVTGDADASSLAMFAAIRRAHLW